MPGYTRAWDPANMLLGSRDADEIDDAVRDFARDLDERFADLVVDVAADPWQLKTLGAVITIPWSEGYIINAVPTIISVGRVYPPTISTAIYVIVPIILPVGSVITNVKARYLRATAGADVTIAFNKADASNVETSVAAPIVPADDPLPQDADFGVLAVAVGAQERYGVIFTIISDGATPSSAAAYHVEVTADIAWGS